MGEKVRFYGTGRRKEAVARVWIEPGKGRIFINGRRLEDYFPRMDHQKFILQPFEVTGTLGKYNVKAKVEGGGISGQAGAVSLGIARALVEAEESLREILKKEGLLKRDPRMKERKKYGLRKARRARQYSKR
ncbi:MAG TPA: 30S ribosomal protein S9 [bacterium]|nr:30S ribosomal protein S9 [bacterium]HEX68469.1 30S ribosomal protein S9 [bacterium]